VRSFFINRVMTVRKSVANCTSVCCIDISSKVNLQVCLTKVSRKNCSEYRRGNRGMLRNNEEN